MSDLTIKIEDHVEIGTVREYRLMKLYRPSFVITKDDATVLVNLLAGELGFNLVKR